MPYIEACILEADYTTPDEISFVLTTCKDDEQMLVTQRGQELFDVLENWLASKMVK